MPSAQEKTSRLGPLQDGSTAAIIGGGVGGSCAALALVREAERKGIRVNVLLVEPKIFGTQYNQCMGVLTPPIIDLLANELGVKINEGMIRRTIAGYRLRGRRDVVELEEGPGEDRTVAIRRVELDRLLLEVAEQSGVRVLPSRVTAIEIHPEEVLVFTDSGTYSADTVIGAFGLDDSMQRAFERLVAYVPPKALQSVVVKMHPSDPRVVDGFHGWVETFLAPVAGTAFAAIVPKGDHLSVVLAGRDVTTKALSRFLELPHVKKLLDFEYTMGPAFKGAFPNRPARNFYGDRFAMIGDAAGLVRPFKGKGINSAAITGIRAAQTIMNDGISRDALRKYARRCEKLAGNVRYGLLVQWLSLLLSRTLGIGPLVRCAGSSNDLKMALYGAVSGTQDYKKVLLTCLKPRILMGLTGAYAAQLGRVILRRSPARRRSQ